MRTPSHRISERLDLLDYIMDFTSLMFSFKFVVRQIGHRRLRWEFGNRGEVWGGCSSVQQCDRIAVG